MPKVKNKKFTKSNRKNKKYKVVFDYKGKERTVHFGDTRYEHYKDSTGTGHYSNKNHLDKKRRKSYRARSKGITNKKGEKTYNNPLYANYWSYHYLW